MARHAESLDRAWQLHRTGQFAEAEKIYLLLLKQRPSDAEVLRLYGNLLRRTNRAIESLPHLERAARLRPNKANVHAELGAALVETGRADEAVNCFRRMVELDPGSSGGYLRLAHVFLSTYSPNQAVSVLQEGLDAVVENLDMKRVLSDALMMDGNAEAALPICQEILKTEPRNPIAHFSVGAALNVLGRVDEALSYFEATLALAPNHVQAIAARAEILERRGEAAEAMESIKAAVAAGARHPDLALAYARLGNRLNVLDEPISLLREVLQKPNLTNQHRSSLHFNLGALLEAREAFDDAFENYQQANSLYGTTFAKTKHRARIADTLATFTVEAMASFPRAVGNTSRPVFVLGMPRSGTSLVEQILASHPDIHGAGELIKIPEIVRSLQETYDLSQPYPQCVSELTQSMVNDASAAYLAHLGQICADSRFVTDKLPDNYYHVGLIAILFPQARVVYCHRDAASNCMSCFATPLHPSHAYATDLLNIAQVYNGHRELMAHWRALDAIPILDVPYRSMIENPEQMVRDLLAFCEVPWDDACLEFHASDRVTTTASRDQVRNPIYTSSLDRGRRFEAHLGPLRQALDGS